ncbi:hypothetical protein HanRHA438_Chr04g0183281 [Helianthus annuus]|nr:hypothetical protein HanRHA438_Chr04g0183281 [Helianthus annuus]
MSTINNTNHVPIQLRMTRGFDSKHNEIILTEGIKMKLRKSSRGRGTAVGFTGTSESARV